MPTSFNALRIRQKVNNSWPEQEWSVPKPFGQDGWLLILPGRRSMILSCAYLEGAEWVHASLAGLGELPSYDELCWMHAAVFGDGYAYQCFVPRSEHVNIHENALHIWGRLDGKPVLPNFGEFGTI